MIFGGTGDLTRRKLMPALFQLGCKSRLPEGLSIVAFARPEMTNDAYRDLMWDSVRELEIWPCEVMSGGCSSSASPTSAAT